MPIINKTISDKLIKVSSRLFKGIFKDNTPDTVYDALTILDEQLHTLQDFNSQEGLYPLDDKILLYSMNDSIEELHLLQQDSNLQIADIYTTFSDLFSQQSSELDVRFNDLRIAIEGDIQDLEGSLSTRISNVVTTLVEPLRTDIDILTSIVNNNNSNIITLNSGFDSLNNDITRIDNSIRIISRDYDIFKSFSDDSFRDIDISIESIRTSFNTINTSFESVNNSVNVMTSDYDVFKSFVDNSIRDSETNITRIDNSVRDLSFDYDIFKNYIGDSFKSIESNNTYADNSITEINRQIEENRLYINDRFVDIDSTYIDINRQIEYNRNVSDDSISNIYTSIDQEIETLNQVIQNDYDITRTYIDNSITDINSEISILKTTINNATQNELNALNSRIDGCCDGSGGTPGDGGEEPGHSTTSSTGAYTYESEEALTTHIIQHNLGSYAMIPNTMVLDDDGYWVKELMPVKFIDENTMEIRLIEPRFVMLNMMQTEYFANYQFEGIGTEFIIAHNLNSLNIVSAISIWDGSGWVNDMGKFSLMDVNKAKLTLADTERVRVIMIRL